MQQFRPEAEHCIFSGRHFTLLYKKKVGDRMRENQLPKSAWKILEENHIKEEDILLVCPFDLSFSGEYVYGYLFATKEYLGVLQSAPIQSEIIRFKGTDHLGDVGMEAVADYSCLFYERKDIHSLRREHMVATNLICMEYGDKKVQLVAHTNLHLAEMDAFLKKFKHLQKGEEIIEEEETKKEEEELFCPICGTKYPDEQRKICPKCMNKRSIFWRTFRYFLKHKLMILVLVFCFVAAAGVNLIWPYLSGTVLYDWVLDKNDEYLAPFGLAGEYLAALGVLLGCMLVSKVLQQAIGILQGSVMARMVAVTVRDIKKDVFAAMGRLSLRFFTSKQTGNLMTRVLGDAERVTGFFLDGFPYIFVHGFTIIASFVVMFRLNWQMSLVACILLPLLVVISVKLKPRIWSLFGRRHRAERAVNSKVNDNLTGCRVVKAFGQQAAEMERFEGPNEYLRDAEVRIERYNNRFTILYNLVQEISSVWVWMLGVFMMMQSNKIEVGVLITFVGYVAQLNGPMNFFSRVFRMWSDSINAAQRMFEIMDAVPEIKEAENPIALTAPAGEIDLSHVSFGYDKNHTVLKDIDFKVKSGEMLGIVGRSGAGKTTLVSLISRLYDVNDGSISIDGINVKELAFKDLRRNVAMVSQDTYIFMGTVADNIAYGDPEASHEEILRAAKLASAHNFIAKMPDGYDTIIGAAGKDLSGGEKQRLSIARAVLSDPKILILDEATASVDTETEKAIQKSLSYLVKGRTTLSIAHRISTLRDANRLVVIDGGRVVEEGTHEELMAVNGVYAKLVELQTKSLALEEESDMEENKKTETKAAGLDMEAISREAEEMIAFRYITKDNSKFTKTEGGFISLDFDGKHYDRVAVIRLFPFTDPDKYISIRTTGDTNREIGVIEDMAAMTEDVKEMLHSQLLLHYFTPVIQKVIDIKDEYGYAYFHVLTDRGECKFTINMGGNAVVRLSDSRLLISDIDENRFEIPDVFALSQKEQRKLDLFL